jgi:endo-1,4-beta-xylanase
VTEPQTSLRETLKERFLLGAALNDAQIAGRDPAALEIVERHFNSISPENVLKWDAVHPEPGRFNFAPVDQYAALGAKLDLFVVGHVLVWHQQTPGWVFEGPPAALLSRLREHIRTVVGRYRGRVHAWDVVNEAFEDDGTWRNSPWYAVLGEEYVAKAFEFAHEADPGAQLLYNDYNLWKTPKREAALRLATSLRERGIRVDAVGEQGHWLLEGPPLEDIEAMLAGFAKAGWQLHITELDVDPLPRPDDLIGADVSKRLELTPALDPYKAGLPEDVQRRLAEHYAGIFSLFMKHPIVSRVTLWGVTDAGTWLNEWPVPGRTNHPLLWDRQARPKPAFHAVAEAIRRAPSGNA